MKFNCYWFRGRSVNCANHECSNLAQNKIRQLGLSAKSYETQEVYLKGGPGMVMLRKVKVLTFWLLVKDFLIFGFFSQWISDTESTFSHFKKYDIKL